MKLVRPNEPPRQAKRGQLEDGQDSPSKSHFTTSALGTCAKEVAYGI